MTLMSNSCFLILKVKFLFLFLFFLSFVFYIVAWKLLKLLESSFAILLCFLLMHETFEICCVVHCCILCLWSISIHLTIQLYLEMTMLLKPTLFENFDITSRIRVTLDKGPRSKVQWNRAFLLIKRFKLVLRDKGPRSRQIKLWFNLHDIILEGKPIGLDKRK